MSDEEQMQADDPVAEDDADADELRDLLRGALAEERAEPPKDMLRGVQRRIRARSHGKFYADGWSTARHPPVATYLLTSLLMLAIVVFVYAVLSPTAGAPVHTPMTPAPVHVVPPHH